MAIPAGSRPVAAQAVSVLPLAPDQSTNAQDAYEWQATHEGDVVIIATLDDLDRYIPAVAGVRTPVPGVYEITIKGGLVLPAGDRFVIPPSGGVTFKGQQTLTTVIIGNYAGPLFSGPVNMIALSTNNFNAGGSDFDLNSPIGAFFTFENVVSLGVNVGTLHDVVAGAFFNGFGFFGNTTGLLITGTIGSVEFIRAGTIGTFASGFISFDVDSSAVVVTTLEWTDCEFIHFEASQIGIRIDTGATLPTTALPTFTVGVFMTGCIKTGPGVLLEESAGFVDTTDIRIFVTNNRGVRDSAIRASSQFDDTANPVTVSYGAANTWTVVPHIGAGGGLMALDAQERFSLVRATTGGPIDSSFPNDWAVRYDGPSLGITRRITWLATVESVSTATNIQGRVEIDVLGTGVTWGGTETVGTTEQANRRQQLSGVGDLRDIDPGHQFRLAFQNLDGTTGTIVTEFRILISR